MGVTNRAKDASEQKDVFQWSYNRAAGSSLGPINTGATAWIAIMPYAGVIQSMRAAAAGLSGAMQIALGVQRFAAGGTLIGAGISNLVVAEFGTSGIMGYSGLAATGSTLLLVQANDVLTITTSVANTAANALTVDVVVKKLQDIVSYHGVST